MAKVAGGRDVQTVNPRVASDPGLRVASGAFQGNARALSDLGGIATGISDSIRLAESNVRKRKDSVDRIKRLGEFKGATAEDNRSTQTSENLTEDDVMVQFGVRTRERREEILAAHMASGATGESLAKLRESMLEEEFRATDDMSAAAFSASQSLVTDALGDERNRLALEIEKDPSRFEDVLDQWRDIAEDAGPALKMEESLKQDALSETAFVQSVVNNFIRNNDPGGARDLMLQSGIGAFVKPETQAALFKKIDDAERRLLDKDKPVVVSAGSDLVSSSGEVLHSTPRTPVNPPAQQTQNFAGPNGEVTVVNMTGPNAAAEIADLKSRGFVEFNPQGVGDTGLTTRGKGDLEQIVRQTDEVFRNADLLEGLLAESPETLGPQGAVEGLLNKTLAAFDPRFFSGDRAKVEGFVNIVRQSALRAVSDESRFSNEDRERVEALFPSTGVFESTPNAVAKIKVMKSFFLRRNITAIQELGGVAPDIETTPEEIRNWVSSNIMNETEAVLALELLFPEKFGVENTPVVKEADK